MKKGFLMNISYTEQMENAINEAIAKAVEGTNKDI